VALLHAYLFGCARGIFLPTALENKFWGVWGRSEYASKPIFCAESVWKEATVKECIQLENKQRNKMNAIFESNLAV
jgi:hypothetical protein